MEEGGERDKIAHRTRVDFMEIVGIYSVPDELIIRTQNCILFIFILIF